MTGTPASLAGGAVSLSHRERTIIIVGLMTGLLLAALDQTIVSTALPTIVGEFGGIDHLSWVVTAYLLASTASMPLYGKISDLYGRKRVYQSAIVLFLVASALCGAAQSMGQLIAFRFLQGIGGGGLMSLTFTIVGDIVPPRERGRYTGYLTGTFALASVIGPLVGGFLTDHLSWRWVFYVNLPIGIVALFVTSSVLRIPFQRVPHRLDLIGAGVLVGSVTSLLLATVWASDEYGWTSPTTIGLYVVAAVGAVGFVWWERRAPEPVLPPRMFTRPGFTSCIAVSFVSGAAMFGAIVYLPLFFQGVQGRQATNAGLLLLPLMLALMVASLVVGRLTTRTGRYKIYPVTGTIVAAGGLWLMSTMQPDTSRLVSSLWMIGLGLGIGATLSVLTIAVQNTVELRDLGAGTASVNFFRTLGSTIGVAVFGAVLTRQLTDAITTGLVGVDVPDGVTPDTLTQNPRALGALPEPLRSIAIGGLSDAITTVFIVAAGVMAIGAVAAITIRELPLRDTAALATTPTPTPEPA
jgi:EmrB/QacA subfamily drug resistance transporter